MDKVSMMKSLVLAVALAAGISGVARADDSSMSRFGGDSYAYFNTQPVDNARSAWRAAHPNGLSENQLEALSSESLATSRSLSRRAVAVILYNDIRSAWPAFCRSTSSVAMS